MASLLYYPTSNQETCQNKLSMKCLRTEKIDFVSKALKNISEYYELLGPLIWYFNVNSGHVYISLLTVEGWVKIIKIKLFSIFGQWICSEMLMQHSGTALYGFILCCARGLSPLVYAVYSKCTSGYSENIRSTLETANLRQGPSLSGQYLLFRE